jgi:Ca2+-binding EF-hand superfamily protein
MKKIIPAILLIASASAYAQQMPSPEQIMKECDKNNDGVVTREEAKGHELEMFFDLVDSNSDGKVTIEELKAIPPPSGGPGSPPPPGGPPKN